MACSQAYTKTAEGIIEKW